MAINITQIRDYTKFINTEYIDDISVQEQRKTTAVTPRRTTPTRPARSPRVPSTGGMGRSTPGSGGGY